MNLPLPPLGGFTVAVDPMAMAPAVTYPKDRFITYGPEDDWFFKKYRPDLVSWKPAAFLVADVMVIHPDLWEKLKADPRFKETA